MCHHSRDSENNFWWACWLVRRQIPTQEWNQCIEDRENGIKWDDRCKDLNEGFFDDCEGYANKEAWYTPPVDDSRRIIHQDVLNQTNKVNAT